MTPEYLDHVDRALAAERAGDATAAFEWHESVPMFRKGRHRSLMERLTRLGDDPPAWVWARWTVYQALRCEDGATGGLVRTWLARALEEIHDGLLAESYRHRGDPIRVIARVQGESWAFHQLAAHEGGALSAFIDEFATGRLAERSALARSWAGTRLSGYELGESKPGARLAVREATGGDWLEVLDLGARSCARGGWVLGRLVPSGVGDLLMFDMPPLGVPAKVAREIAAGEDRSWWRVVAGAVGRGDLGAQTLLREDYELTTDVLELELLRFGTPAPDLGRVMQQLRSGRDEVGRAAYRVLERARRGDLAATDHAYIGAAAMNVRAFDDVRRRMMRTDEPDHWAEWADRMPDPARGRVLALGRMGRSAA